jgi:hypothetical protein
MKQLLAKNFVACALAVSGILTADFVNPNWNPVLAQTSPSPNSLVDATMPYTILSMAQGIGTASIEKDGNGDPVIRGTRNGTKYSIWFYGCVDGKDCDDIIFYAGWNRGDVSLARINRWNAKSRYGKGYLDGDGDPCLEMVVNIDYGVSRKNLEDSFNWWTKAIDSFTREVLNE